MSEPASELPQTPRSRDHLRLVVPEKAVDLEELIFDSWKEADAEALKASFDPYASIKDKSDTQAAALALSKLANKAGLYQRMKEHLETRPYRHNTKPR